MKRAKIVIISAVLLLAVSAFAVPALAAAAYQTPAEAAAGVTGKPVEEVISEKQESGKTYGAIAAEEGKLEEFKEEMLETKKDRLQEKVDTGKITQEQADKAAARIKKNQANCDGTGNGGGVCDGTGIVAGQRNQNRQSNTANQRQGGQNNGNGFGQGNATGQGQGGQNGSGQGTGTGRGAGRGNGLRDGSCVQ